MCKNFQHFFVKHKQFFQGKTSVRKTSQIFILQSTSDLFNPSVSKDAPQLKANNKRRHYSRDRKHVTALLSYIHDKHGSKISDTRILQKKDKYSFKTYYYFFRKTKQWKTFEAHRGHTEKRHIAQTLFTLL